MKFAPKYVAAIKYLVDNPLETEKLWYLYHTKEGCLFQLIGQNKESLTATENGISGTVGCATLIKQGYLGENAQFNGCPAFAQIPELTAAIKASNIPTTQKLFKAAQEATKNRANRRKFKKILEEFAFVQTVCDFLFQRS